MDERFHLLHFLSTKPGYPPPITGIIRCGDLVLHTLVKTVPVLRRASDTGLSLRLPPARGGESPSLPSCPGFAATVDRAPWPDWLAAGFDTRECERFTPTVFRADYLADRGRGIGKLRW